MLGSGRRALDADVYGVSPPSVASPLCLAFLLFRRGSGEPGFGFLALKARRNFFADGLSLCHSTHELVLFLGCLVPLSINVFSQVF